MIGIVDLYCFIYNDIPKLRFEMPLFLSSTLGPMMRIRGVKAPPSFVLNNLQIKIETLYDYCILHLTRSDGRKEDVVLPGILSVRSYDGRLAICGDPWTQLLI